MGYATLQDLVDRFTADEIEMLSGGNAAAVTLALEDAGNEISAALRGRYALPLPVVDPLLVRLACDLARESLYADRPTDNVVERAKLARQILNKIATGHQRLDLSPHAPVVFQAGLVEIISGRRKSPFGG